MNRRGCDYAGCQRFALPYGFVYGCAYCEDHYLLGLEHALLEEVASVVAGNPSTKFRNLLGRYAEGLYSAKNVPMPEGLAGNKIRDRAEEVQYEGEVINFSIERHLRPIPTRQRWCFDLGKKELILMSEEPLYLGCEEAAELIGRTPATVCKYIREHKLHAKRASEMIEIQNWFRDKYERGHDEIYSRTIFIMPPRKWLIPQEEIVRFMSEH